MRVALFQPCYPHGKSQTYLPGGLMNLGSRLLMAGIETSFTDLNHVDIESQQVRQELDDANVIGFTVLGAPYIPGVAYDVGRLRAIGYRQPIFIGGEGVARLESIDFKTWLGGKGIVQIRNDKDLVNAIGTQVGMKPIPSAFETSMVPMLRRLSPNQLTRYLTQEFALFLSNGCIFGCKFCQAKKNSQEEYRTVQSLEDEVEFIAAHLRSVGHPSFTAYLTNLDLFQNPEQLAERLSVIHRICRQHGITPCLRGLATSKYTTLSCRQDHSLAYRLNYYGLKTVGFGADGADETTWRRENKRHNTLSELEMAVRMMKAAGISSELLMVLGLQDSQPREIFTSIRFSFRHALRGIVVRPYLGKSRTPGGHWFENDPQVQLLQRDASLLSRLDYAMLGSRETHPRWQERWLANAAYLLIVGALSPFGLCPTSPLVPVPARGPLRTIAQSINRLMPFDR
jgi:hypothetical protein